MKHFVSVLFVFFATMAAVVAAEAKNITMAVNSLTVIDVPFKIEEAKVSSPSVAKVEVIGENQRQFRITGIKAGITDIQLRGGGMDQMYKVTVIENLALLLNDLKRELDALPEIDISKSSTKIVLKGEISSIANLELKNRVVKSYGNEVILDLTTFHPAPEVMLALHKNLEKAGFKVIRNNHKATVPGEVSILLVGDMLTISGMVYSPADLKRIRSIILSQYWLTLPVDNKTTGVGGKVAAYLDIQVLPVMLQLDIIHVAINRQEARGLGIDWSQFVDNGFGAGVNLMYALQKIRGQDTIKTANSAIGAGTNGTLMAWLQIMGQHGVNRVRRAGFVTFKSNDPKEFRMQNGGKIVLSSTAGVGATSQLKDYEYGLILQGIGGLTGVETVSVDLRQELSYPGPISKYTVDAKLELKKFETRAAYVGKLGEPIAIAGLKEFTQENTNTSSIPYLRNIPVFKWFISQEGNTFKEDQVITLICIRKMDPASKVDPVAVELNKMKIAEDKNLQERETSQHKNDGKWYEFWRW